MPVYEEKDKSRWTKDGRRFYFRTPYVDMYGKRKQKNSKMYKSRPAAKKAEDEFLLSVATTDETDLDIMFEDVYKEWLIFKGRTVKESSIYGITHTLNKNLIEFFKNFKLHSIKGNSISQWYKYLDDFNYSIDYNNKIIGYFKEILEYAHMNYEFDIKVLCKVEKETNNDVRKVKNDSEWNYWTYDEFNQFISYVDDELYYKIFNFLYFTGLRKAEMLALNWTDINFEKQTLNINKQISTKFGTGTYKITSTKTKNSDAIIDLDDELIKLLKKHYEHESKLYGFNTSFFIFGNIKPISGTSLGRKLKHYIDLSGVKKITPHGFRHSHASLLIHLGCDEYQVAARLRDTVQTVMTTYYHMFPEKKNATINTLNNFKNKQKQDVIKM